MTITDRLRKVYRWIGIAFIIIGLCLFFFVKKESRINDGLSILANLSEMFGLTFLLVEVYYIEKETEKLKIKINNIDNLTAFSRSIGLISIVKENIQSGSYNSAHIRLEIVKEYFISSIVIVDEIENFSEDLKKIDNILTTLSYINNSILPNKKKQDYLTFLTEFSSKLSLHKENFKNNLI